jgi:6-pyruvoyltetrahydropterin/6-carboxytetrahydropterin synthase
MYRIRVTKEFHFEAAHALHGYDGPCRHAHGHSYTLAVTVIGTPNDHPEASKFGMVIDFGDLKRLVKKEIIDIFDHALIVQDNEESRQIPEQDPFRNLIRVPYQPTSENMLIDFAGRIIPLLPENIELFSLKLRETDSSYAEWFANDNPAL